MIEDTHPFLVEAWLAAQWMEIARCKTYYRAGWVAQACFREHHLVRISELQEGQFIPISWYPDKPNVEQATQQQQGVG